MNNPEKRVEYAVQRKLKDNPRHWEYDTAFKEDFDYAWEHFCENQKRESVTDVRILKRTTETVQAWRRDDMNA